MALGLGRVGAWSRGLRYNADRAAAHAAVAELEALGYGAAWLPDTGGDVLGDVGAVLAATSCARRCTATSPGGSSSASAPATGRSSGSATGDR